MGVEAEMETSSQVKGFISGGEEGVCVGGEELWIVGVPGKFIGGEYLMLLASHVKDSV